MTTVVVALVPHVGLIYGRPAQQVALQTAASLIILLAGFLVLGRLRRNSRRNELVLVTALAVIATSNVLFVMLPVLMGPATATTAAWAAMIGRLVGSLLFAVAAFVPRTGLLRPRRAERLAAAAVVGILAPRGVFMNVFRDHAPGPLSAATRNPAETAGPGDAQAAPEPADLLVIGLGYVGLPLAREAAFAGLTVVGYDLNIEVVAGLNAGRSHVGDVPAGDIAEMLRKGFRATASEEEAGDPDTVVICVPTPLSADSASDLSAVRGAVEVTGRLLRPGMLVVLESTTYPGTTDEVVRPLLEKASGLTAGVDFSLAFSPERIDPGNPDYSIRNTPKVVGGQTSSCADAAERFYGQLCDQVVRARSAREAEMTKLLENTYRHVNIALVNEMAIFCHELGVDLRDAIRCAATKPFGFQAFHPGPGVGGHCIPIDPNYLSYKVRTLGYPFRFVELAQEINSRMPVYTVDRAAEVLNSHAKPLKGAHVLLLGVTYKPNVADQRESPVQAVGRKLRKRGAVLTYHDPYVHEWRLKGEPVRRADDLDDEIAGADLVILLQDHAAYDLDRISRQARLVLDTRGRLAGPNVEML